MTSQTKSKIQSPLYAAAGAGDLAYQRLRQVPAVVAKLRDRVTTGELDAERLRGSARRNASAVVAGARAASQRATVIYDDLVTHGERVVQDSRRRRGLTEDGDAVVAELEQRDAGTSSERDAGTLSE